MNDAVASLPDLDRRLAADIAAAPADPVWRREFAPELSYGRHDGPPRSDARLAAVALVLCWDGHHWSLPLTVRNTNLSRHGGQVSLPGGLVEVGESVREAARRELCEELGVEPPLDWLGELAPLFVFNSNAYVTPCVARISGCPAWQPQAGEVDRVLRLDLADLVAQDEPPPMTISRGPVEFLAPRFVVEDHSVWGATAVLLAELRGRLRRIANSLKDDDDLSNGDNGQRASVRVSLANEETGPRQALRTSAARGAIEQKSTLLAVTFDLDGLMFNSEELYHEVGATLLSRRGKQITGELLNEMMGRQAHAALGVMIKWHGLDATPEELAAECAELFVDLLPARLQPMPGLLDLLAALEANGIPKAIATSSRREFVDRALGLFDLAPRFAFVITAEDVEHGKPAPDVYQLAAQRHGLEPAQMMVLEDSQNGCAAAVAAGAYTVAVPHGQSLQHKFPGVRFVADTLADERIYGALEIEKGPGRG
jgi:HAD superfamily hydrolase (TIGR01509 family)